MSEPTPVPVQKRGLRKELEEAINRCSAENGSNTPDFILAEYLEVCLAAFDAATLAREKWYGCCHHSPGQMAVSCGKDAAATEIHPKSDPLPVPIQKLGQGCAVESLLGVLRVKEPGAPLTVFAIVRLSDDDLDDIHGKEKADVIRADIETREVTRENTFDLVGYVNSSRLWPRLRERGGQTLVDEVRGALGLDPEAVSRARLAKAAEEAAKRPKSEHYWEIQKNSRFCRRCGAHEDGGPCRPFAPGDLEGMCQHDAYRNEACVECGRAAEITVRTKADVQKLVIDHNALHPGKSKVVFDEAAFDNLLKFHDPSVVNSLYDSLQEAIEIEELVFSGVPFDEAIKRVHGSGVQSSAPTDVLGCNYSHLNATPCVSDRRPVPSLSADGKDVFACASHWNALLDSGHPNMPPWSEPKRFNIVCPDGKARTGAGLIEPMARLFLPTYNQERICTKDGVEDPCPGGEHRMEEVTQ